MTFRISIFCQWIIPFTIQKAAIRNPMSKPSSIYTEEQRRRTATATRKHGSQRILRKRVLILREVYHYPNKQRGALLWYHDHAMAITRLNVYAGLAGMYIIRERKEKQLKLPPESTTYRL